MVRFEIIDLDEKSKGLLQIDKERTFKVMVMVGKDEGSEADKLRLMEDIKTAYIDFYRRTQNRLMEVEKWQK